jgi:hypothetical protein
MPPRRKPAAKANARAADYKTKARGGSKRKRTEAVKDDSDDEVDTQKKVDTPVAKEEDTFDHDITEHALAWSTGQATGSDAVAPVKAPAAPVDAAAAPSKAMSRADPEKTESDDDDDDDGGGDSKTKGANANDACENPKCKERLEFVKKDLTGLIAKAKADLSKVTRKLSSQTKTHADKFAELDLKLTTNESALREVQSTSANFARNALSANERYADLKMKYDILISAADGRTKELKMKEAALTTAQLKIDSLNRKVQPIANDTALMITSRDETIASLKVQAEDLKSKLASVRVDLAKAHDEARLVSVKYNDDMARHDAEGAAQLTQLRNMATRMDELNTNTQQEVAKRTHVVSELNAEIKLLVEKNKALTAEKSCHAISLETATRRVQEHYERIHELTGANARLEADMKRLETRTSAELKQAKESRDNANSILAMMKNTLDRQSVQLEKRISENAELRKAMEKSQAPVRAPVAVVSTAPMVAAVVTAPVAVVSATPVVAAVVTATADPKADVVHDNGTTADDEPEHDQADPYNCTCRFCEADRSDNSAGGAPSAATDLHSVVKPPPTATVANDDDIICDDDCN